MYLLLPWPLLHVTLALSPPPRSPRDFIQGCPNLCFFRLLTPQCIPPVSSNLIDLFSCAHLKNRPQRHPLCHCPMLSNYVGHFQLSSPRLTHCFLPESHPPPFCLLSRPLPRNLTHKTRVCALHLHLHHCQNCSNLKSKN